MKVTIRNIVAAALLLPLCLQAFCQQYWEFGDRYKAYVHHTASLPLAVKMNGVKSLASYSFVSRVGGVAFQTIAKPDANFSIESNFSIDYVSYNPDGRRLRVINGDDTLYPYLPDWQLIPIAQFSNDNNNSCVSLFGPLSDASNYDIVYHRSFTNRLLGLRILQADMALMDTRAHYQLPKYSGKIILGAGEKNTSLYEGEIASRKIENILSKYLYSSWVLTDDNISFFIQNGEITFKGTPYYYFWITNKELDQMQYYLLLDRIERHKGTHIDSIRATALSIKIERDLGKEPKVIPVNDAINALKKRYDLLLQLNTPVFKAMLNASHYSAFFRFVKNKNSNDWVRFITKIRTVQVKPEIKTPTTLPKS